MFWECDGIKENMKTGDKETHEIKLKHTQAPNIGSWALITMTNDYTVHIKGSGIYGDNGDIRLTKNKKELERLITWLVDSYNDISD